MSIETLPSSSPSLASPRLGGSPLAALKEWQSIVASLEAGQTRIILRKGGILEAKTGFQLEHDRFYLLPTQWHEQESSGTLDPKSFQLPTPIVRSIATVERVQTFQPGDDLSVLDGQHAYTPAQVAKRRDFKPKLPLHAIFVRVEKLPVPVELDADVSGCRSWVELQEFAVRGSQFAEVDGELPTANRERRTAFTLVELLVVVGIIAMLISILLPALSGARNSASSVKTMSDLRQLSAVYLQYANENGGRLLPGYLPANPPGVFDRVTKNIVTGTPARRWPFRLAATNSSIWKLIRPQREVTDLLRSPENASTYPVFGLNTIYLGGHDSPTFAGFPAPKSHVVYKVNDVRRSSQQIVFVEVRIGGSSSLAVTGDEAQLGFHYATPPRAAGQHWTVSRDLLQYTSPLTGAAGIPTSRSGLKSIAAAMLDGHVERLALRELKDMRRWSPRADRPDWDYVPWVP